MSPELVLEGETPRLIDEWQEVPPLWDAVRHRVDKTARKGAVYPHRLGDAESQGNPPQRSRADSKA